MTTTHSLTTIEPISSVLQIMNFRYGLQEQCHIVAILQ